MKVIRWVGCWHCLAQCPIPIGVVGDLWSLLHKLRCPVQGEQAEALTEAVRRG